MLKQRLIDDLKAAMKEKDVIKKNVVTMIRAGILQIEKDNKIIIPKYNKDISTKYIQ